MTFLPHGEQRILPGTPVPPRPDDHGRIPEVSAAMRTGSSAYTSRRAGKGKGMTDSCNPSCPWKRNSRFPAGQYLRRAAVDHEAGRMTGGDPGDLPGTRSAIVRAGNFRDRPHAWQVKKLKTIGVPASFLFWYSRDPGHGFVPMAIPPQNRRKNR
jgi:hypothetical protein